MGWIKDMVDDMIEWAFDKIFRPFKKWVLEVIADIQQNLRNFMHTLKQWLAKWLAEDWFFCLFVAGIIVVLVFGAALATYIGDSAVFQKIAGIVKAIVDKVVSLIDIKAFIDLKFLDTILRTFVAEYKEVRSSMTNAISGLAADLGEGTGWLNGLMESARGTIVGTSAILGLDPRSAEIEWYGEASAFTKRVNDRFYHYARDPGEIYSDFFNEVLLPRAEQNQNVQQAQLDQIRDNYRRTVEIDTGLILVNKSVEDFIALMPASVEKQFQRRWDDIEGYVDDLLLALKDDIRPMMLDLQNAFELRNQMQTAVNEEVSRKQNDPADLVLNYLDYDETEKRIAEIGLSDMLTDGEASKALLDRPDAAVWQERLDHGTIGIASTFGASLALTYEPTGYGRFAAPRGVSIPSPFVGDY
jgi:hypothetical protein